MSQSVIDIKLGGATLAMRPDCGAYRDIEDRVGYPMTEIYEVAKAQRLKLNEVALIVFHGCVAAKQDVDLEAVAARLFEGRFASNPEIFEAVMRLILAFLHTPEVATKKFEAEVQPVMDLMRDT